MKRNLIWVVALLSSLTFVSCGSRDVENLNLKTSDDVAQGTYLFCKGTSAVQIYVEKRWGVPFPGTEYSGYGSALEYVKVGTVSGECKPEKFSRYVYAFPMGIDDAYFDYKLMNIRPPRVFNNIPPLPTRLFGAKAEKIAEFLIQKYGENVSATDIKPKYYSQRY